MRTLPSKTELGKRYEDWAADFLQQQGYVLKSRNYRSGRNEIDLVMQDRQTLVFVEVKGRRPSAYGHPEEAVDEAKAERLQRAATDYQHEHNWQGPVRFDILAVEVKGKRIQMRHFKDAF